MRMKMIFAITIYLYRYDLVSSEGVATKGVLGGTLRRVVRLVFVDG